MRQQLHRFVGLPSLCCVAGAGAYIFVWWAIQRVMV